MKAMVLPAIGPIEQSPLQYQDVADPQAGPGEIRVCVRACGVCRTDLHVIEGDLPQQKLPVIPGHQVVGEVDQVGEGCTRLKGGQRAGIAWLRGTCGRCGYCRSGRENLCENQRFTGYHADGGYAQYAIVREEFAYEIPEQFSDEQAAPLLCAGIVGFRAMKRANLPRGGRLAVYGFGSSAHVIAQIALHWGCELYAVSRSPHHQRLAMDLGAKWAGADAEDLPVEVDSAILFAPVGDLVPPALRKLRKGGTLAMAGIYMTPVPRMDYEDCLFYERDLRSVTANTRDDGRELLQAAADADVRAHVTTYPLRDANRALADLKADRVNGTAVLIP